MKPSLTIFYLILIAAACSYGVAAQKVKVPTIQGKLVTSNSRPLPYTELELVPLDLEQVPNDSRFVGVSNTLGKFEFKDVPPGEYTLSINFGEKPTFLSPFATYFYPGSTDRGTAMVFSIDNATRLSGIVFKLRTALEKKPIVGLIRWPDGKPVEGAVIVCRDIEFDTRNDFGGSRSDKNGRFSLEAFVGRSYQVGIILFDRDIKYPYFETGEIIGFGETADFTLSSTLPPLDIKVSDPENERTTIEKYLG